MSTCPCCGQPIKAAASSPIWGDEAFLGVCNAAYEDAARRGMAEVTVAHLALAIASCRSSQHAFGQLGVLACDLAEASTAVISETTVSSAGGRPTVAGEMRSVLERAQAVTRERGRDLVSLEDALFALLYRCRDLPGVVLLNRRHNAAAQARRTAPPMNATSAGTLSGPSTHAAAMPRLSHPRDHVHARWERRGLASVETHPRHAHTDEMPEHSRLFAQAPRLIENAAHVSLHSASGRQTDISDSLSALTLRLAEQDRLIAELCLRLNDAAAPRPPRERPARALAVRAERSAAPQQPAGRIRKAPTSDGETTGTDQSARSRRLGKFAERRTHRAEASETTRSRSLMTFGRRTRRSEWMQRTGSRGKHDEGGALRRQDAHRAHDDTSGDDSLEGGEKVFHLTLADPVASGPSIGPKTASRLAPLGIETVRDLLDCDPGAIAAATGVRHITKRRVTEWIAQARLVCTVPWLRGTHAQLLVGSGFDSAEKIARADSVALCAAVLRFAQTREGQSILRSGPPPDVERIVRWVAYANQAEPDRAA